MTFLNYQRHPDPSFQIRMIEALTPLISGDFLVTMIRSAFLHQREKNAAKEVKSGLECGITFRNFLDFKEKDMIESYKVDMIERQIND